VTAILKGLMIVLDGLGDRPSPALDGRTPLQAAATPVMDELARQGRSGLCDPLSGIAVDTPTGTGLLLGLPPKDLGRLQRGPVEAAGVGLALAPGDVALRCNFATLHRSDAGLEIVDRRAGRVSTGAAELAEAVSGMDLGEGITATVRPATRHRAVLRLSGEALSGDISDTDPGADVPTGRVLVSHALSTDARAALTAWAVNRFLERAHERLRDHPVNRAREASGQPAANGFITRGAGVAQELVSVVTEMRLAAAVVAGERTIVGLGRLLGFSVIDGPGFTGTPATDLNAKVAAALRALASHDLVFLHVKAPDICAHDRDPRAKRDILEAIDAALVPVLAAPVVVGVNSDHCTDSTSGVHCGDPVPCLLRHPQHGADEGVEFSEAACASGGLGRTSSSAYVDRFIRAMRVSGAEGAEVPPPYEKTPLKKK
jgi:2,3-bisphosphoglycerate-independent phosphoglycerate mutase